MTLAVLGLIAEEPVVIEDAAVHPRFIIPDFPVR